jgi:hypothetical protein
LIKFDKTQGIIRLNSLFEINNNIPLDQLVQLEILGTNINQKSSYFTLTIDLSQILGTYYASFIFNPNVNLPLMRTQNISFYIIFLFL